MHATKSSVQGLALVIGDLHHDFNGDPEGSAYCTLYVDKNIVITARRHPLKPSIIYATE